MNDQEFAALIEYGAEQRGVEFKGPGAISDQHYTNRVTRAILGMTNRLDGGLVVIGVEEGSSGLNPIGLSDEIARSWTRDALADKVAPLVDPSVDFDLEHHTYQNCRFVLIRVREFDETPVFCRVNRNDANNNPVLREGALYVRSRRKPETVEIRTSQEMRDLLDLALRKRLRHFLELVHAGGPAVATLFAEPDRERFKAQIADLEL